MLKNYIKIAFRSLIRNRAFSLINIFGLAIGLSAAMFIGLWVNEEYAYDKFHEKKDRIYQIINEVEFNGRKEVTMNSPVPLAEVLENEISGIEKVVKMSKPHLSLFVQGDLKLEESGLYVDSGFFDVFDFKLKYGDESTALNNKFSVIISEKLAQKLFPGQTAMGKSVVVDDWGRRNEFTVTGILAEAPEQSQLQFDYLIPYDIYLEHRPWYNKWDLYNEPLIVLLENTAPQQEVEKNVSNVIFSNHSGLKTTSYLYPFKDIYLHSNFSKGINAEGKIVYVRMFIIIGVLIILIACINFMNLSTAKSAKRAREVGVRKTVGAHQTNLIFQFLGESILLALLSGAVAITITHVLLPFFNTLTEKSIEMPLTNGIFLSILIMGCIITGCLAGLYPAFFLSRFSPGQVLKGIYKGNSMGSFRKVLVIIQFTLSIIFIVGTIVIYKQFNYVMNKDLGAKKENILYHHLNGIMGDPTAYKAEIVQLPGVENATMSTSSPFEGSSTTISVEWPGKLPDVNTTFDVIQADEDFIKTFDIDLLKKAQHQIEADTANIQFLLNEEAVKAMQLQEPIGTEIEVFSAKGTVVGVTENFHHKSLFEKIGPVIILITDKRIYGSYIALKQDADVSKTISKIKDIYFKYETNYPFDYSFVDEQYAQKYTDVSKVGKLSGIFTGIAILVSCLGLFALSSYMAEQRKAELGIRKVFGASVFQLTSTFSKQFLKLIIIALLISLPVCWYVVRQWLERFEYRIELSAIPFLLGGLAVVIIALITISFNTLKVATTNPAETLRQE